MSLTLTNIPAIMRANKWPHGADLMDSWFARKIATAPKYGLPDTTTVTMGWALGFKRAKDVFDQVVKDRIWATPKAQVEIGKLLRRKGLLAPGTRTFGDLGARVELQDPDYVTYHAVGFSYTDLDDMSAALGNFLFRVVVAGTVTGAAAPAKPASGPAATPKYQVKVTEVGLYVADSYDFNGDQPLGFWNEKKNTMSMINPFAGDYVDNESFRDWRKAHGMGGDFRVLSDVRRVPLARPDTFDVA